MSLALAAEGEAVGEKGIVEDVSVSVNKDVDALALCLEGSEERVIEMVVGRASSILLNPPLGRRKDTVIEKAARTAAIGMARVTSLNTQDSLRLLSGVVVQLTLIIEEDSAQKHDDTLLYLVQAAKYLVKTASFKSKDALWKILDDADPKAALGRGMVAAVAKTLLDLAANDTTPKKVRTEALEALTSFVLSTPSKRQAPLWRCFLPGLFGGLATLILRPGAPVDGPRLKACALDAALALLQAVLTIKKSHTQNAEDCQQEYDFEAWRSKTISKKTNNSSSSSFAQKSPAHDILTRQNAHHTRIEVTNYTAWENEARTRINGWLPAMLTKCRRDPAESVRLAAIEAAAQLLAFDLFHFEKNDALNTLAALRFDTNPTVARAAHHKLKHCILPALFDWNSSAQSIRNAAHSGNEPALLDALNMLAGKLAISTKKTYISHENARHIFFALAAAGELSRGHEKNRITPLESPLPPPPALCCLHPYAQERRAAATRMGAVAHAPAYEWLRHTETRDAYRRCAWLLMLKAGTLAAASDCLTTLLQDNKEDAPAMALVLTEGLEALASEAQLVSDDACIDLVAEEVDEKYKKEHLAIAEALADDVLLALDDEDRDLSHDDAIVARGHLEVSAPHNTLTAVLCRVLAFTIELASCTGGSRSRQSLLRRALYPLLERLAHTDGATRQAALAALIHVAATADNSTHTSGKQEESVDEDIDALATLLRMNMDYVVDAACRRLRAAKSADAAAKASGVLEALLRHSKCSLATPLLSDLARYALRDIDDHCVNPKADHHLAYIRLLRAMLSTLSTPQKKASTKAKNPHEADWLRSDKYLAPLLKGQGGFTSPFEPVLAEMKEAQMYNTNQTGTTEEKEEDSKKSTGTTSLREQYRSVRDHYKKKDEEEAMNEPSAEEQLVAQVLMRVRYFTSPGFALIVRRIAFESMAQGAVLLESNPNQLRPLIHDTWHAIEHRLPKSNEEYYGLILDEPSEFSAGEAIRCLCAAFNVIGVFIDAVGDFLSFKFKDDIWPAIQCVLSDASLTAQDDDSIFQFHKRNTSAIPVVRTHRIRLLESAIHCLAAFGRRPDTRYLLLPITAHAARLALHHDHPAIPHTLRALAAVDSHTVWSILLQAYAAVRLSSRTPTTTTTMKNGNSNSIAAQEKRSSTEPPTDEAPYTEPPLPYLPRWSGQPPRFNSPIYVRDMCIAQDELTLLSLLKACQ